MEEQRRLRKYENALIISGAGVIAFSIWSIVKAVVYFLLSPLNEFSQLMSKDEMTGLYDAGISERTVDYFLLVAILVFLSFDLIIRLYVGTSAIADGGRQKKKGVAYIVLAVLVGMGLLSSLITETMDLISGQERNNIFDRSSVSLIVELTSLLAMIEMIHAAIMVRRLRKRMGMTKRENI